MRKNQRKKRQTKTTFSKMWMNRLLWFCSMWITFSYVLAYLGYTEIAQALSQTACNVIIGTTIPYFAKSFFETYSEEKLKFQKEQYYSHEADVESEHTEAVG